MNAYAVTVVSTGSTSTRYIISHIILLFADRYKLGADFFLEFIFFGGRDFCFFGAVMKIKTKKQTRL